MAPAVIKATISAKDGGYGGGAFSSAVVIAGGRSSSWSRFGVLEDEVSFAELALSGAGASVEEEEDVDG